MTREADAQAQNCWPQPEVADNVNRDELGNLGLTDAEVDAIVAFMKTLTDGYVLPRNRAMQQAPSSNAPARGPADPVAPRPTLDPFRQGSKGSPAGLPASDL